LTTQDLIEAIRSDIRHELEDSLWKRIEPIIQQRLYANVFDLKEATRYLNVSESTLRRMVDEKQIPHFRQRGQIYFRQLSLDRWMEAQERENYIGKG
jgi:excisionase family DNA binding protein